MKSGPIFLLFASAALIGWFAPGLPGGEIGSANTEGAGNAKKTDARLGVNQTDQWLAGETVLRRQSDGHFYADALVDGRPYRFLVDTGASIVALTGPDAEAMGLYWNEESLRPIGRGASGTVHGVPVRIDRMELGGVEARNVQAAIIPEGLDISLLGQSFLSQVSNVEISGDEMKIGG
jgi:aspartyl protease family protein